ncbi:glutamate racemase [Terricaulis silvestris]|uniref:Glutamate racemase n=1 Tax=Terricaulis silvestris TaxID=2686094 RepID=A0A6I6MWC7_9CAUL|nr:glutamate racemase [Terricaulis silvestris]QGZ96724.1 Glutamate racemase [Terricaulis silvestris]
MVNSAKRVLVFDSGVGGLSVFDAIAASGHALELSYAADNAWLPYGLKSDAELKARVPALLIAMVRHWVPDAVVVACNTASTIALEDVRAALSIPVVGVVPPIKPAAALTKTGTIGLLATPATVRRAYTDDLIAQFAPDKTVVRFGSAALVEAAEQKLRGDVPDRSAITEAIEGLFGAPGGGDIDVVAVACTHFPLLAEELSAASPRPATWLDSGAAIARRVVQVLSAETGVTRAQYVGFTDMEHAHGLAPALRARGFEGVSRIGSSDFALAAVD